MSPINYISDTPSLHVCRMMVFQAETGENLSATQGSWEPDSPLYPGNPPWNAPPQRLSTARNHHRGRRHGGRVRAAPAAAGRCPGSAAPCHGTPGHWTAIPRRVADEVAMDSQQLIR